MSARTVLSLGKRTGHVKLGKYRETSFATPFPDPSSRALTKLRELWEFRQPLVGEVVRPNDAGVGRAALSEVELAIWPNDGIVGLVVPSSWEIRQHLLCAPIRSDPQERIGIH